MMLLTECIEKYEKTQKDTGVHIDACIALCGVYSLSSHFHYEAGRGVDEISAMKPAGGFTQEQLNYYSPIWRLNNMTQSKAIAGYEKVPKIL